MIRIVPCLFRWALLPGLVLAAEVYAQNPTPSLVDRQLAVRTAATGLEQPINLAFLGRGDMLVLEKATGRVQRVVNGVVYAPEHGGFLYHTWNEVWIAGEGWRPVDPTLAQPRADATHLALAVGESAAALAPLAGMVGRARVLEVGGVAHW